MKFFRLSNQAAVELGEELGRGGEGQVTRVVDEPGLVAKVYFTPPDARKAAKLRILGRQSSPELLAVAAWPVDVLVDANGATRGVLMPRLDRIEELHELYTPRSRRRVFPGAQFDFLVTVALNLARCVKVMHDAGKVIGDVNHGNAMVMPDGGIRLIDCDSFQLRDGDSLYTCDVGVALFTPPELQGRSFRGIERHANQDSFGLAVLLFHLLFQGRHPFAGRSDDPEMTIERAIAEGRFAYGANAAQRGVSPPPMALDLAVFGDPIAALFERAFTAGEHELRPAADRWVTALEALQRELVVCVTDADHRHLRERPCCWCEVESRAATVWFGGPLRAMKSVNVEDVTLLWRRIEFEPLKIVEQSSRSEYLSKGWFKTQENRKGSRFVFFILFMFCSAGLGQILPLGVMAAWFLLAGGGLLAFVLIQTWRGRDMDPGILAANERWLEARVADFEPGNFERGLAELDHIRSRLTAIATRPEAAIREIYERHTDDSRRKHLEGSSILGASNAELGSEDLRRLETLGVRTAADVLARRGSLHHGVRIWQAQELFQWADSRASEFVLDERFPLSSDPEWANQELVRQVRELMNQLEKGPERLRECARLDQAAYDAMHLDALRRVESREVP